MYIFTISTAGFVKGVVSKFCACTLQHSMCQKDKS